MGLERANGRGRMPHGAGALDELACEAALWNGKGATLAWLAPRLRASRVPHAIGLAWVEWRARREQCLRRIGDAIDTPLAVVRSDRGDEDRIRESAAGRYRSYLDVARDDPACLAEAIDAVFDSYGRARAEDRVLVQQQVAPISAAVVASTHGLPDGAPYYALSLSRGPRSDAVTRGDSDVETWYVSRDRADTAALPEPIRACLDALLELERLAGMTPCEAEIVIGDAGIPWTVQLRRLAIAVGDDRAVVTLRRNTQARIAAARGRVPLLGMMPDWNPAELLGEHPRPLACDLFDRLIARRAWRIGRAAFGYSQRCAPRLLHVHGGRPYIDVAASFRSLLPSTLEESLAERLVAAWIARLEGEPSLHDKIEFEIAITSVTCDFDAMFEARHGHLFSSHERDALRSALLPVTKRVLDAALTKRLTGLFEQAPRHPSVAEPRALRRRLREIEMGIGVAFAAAARQAFVAEALLRSAVNIGALTAERLGEIKRGIETVASEFQHAWADAGEDREPLMHRFGRQRAGTFDLCAPTLTDIASELDERTPRPATSTAAVTLAPEEAARLTHALAASGIEIPAQDLMTQYARAVRARELGKFALADAVSSVLDALASLAQKYGIGREEAGWLKLDTLLAPDAGGLRLREKARAARARHSLEARLRMPLLVGRGGLDVVAFLPGRPSYFGTGRVHARPVRADAYSRPETVPRHALLAIASADPGFEWMFLRRPAAIVTAYGGPNSHIAIRCAELGIPALLGVGPEAFRRILGTSHVMIDFDSGTWSIA